MGPEPLPVEPRRSGPEPNAPVSPWAMIFLAATLGLFGGYLDVAAISLKTFYNNEGYFRTAPDFPWTVPLGHALLLTAVGVLVAVRNGLKPRPLGPRAASWIFASLTLWAAFARLPMNVFCALIAAVGLGRVVGQAVARWGASSRRTRLVQAGLVGMLVLSWGLTTGRAMLLESRTIAKLPAAPRGARNVVLIVWDTVRAYSLGVYGHSRSTTPNLSEWARKGAVYERALAPAPWTYPSHSSFFTGQWPYLLNSQWEFQLKGPYPTLAEHLASRGYQTAGFAANTNCCSYETGLARGFAHFEDYPLTPRALLTRTVPGKWALEQIAVLREDFYDRKWIDLQSRGAGEVNGAFLRWLGQRRSDRPYFAFLNFFDAHEPYSLPSDFPLRFGVPPRTKRDQQLLVDFVGLPKDAVSSRDLHMVHDSYETCVAYLDRELGRLLAELERQGALENTDVIITADHGEAFGDHATIGHGYNVYLDEIGVPLIVLSRRAPAGARIASPVSLRDLPATVVDLAGLADGSPFPGRSLASYWGRPSAPDDEISTPAFTEQVDGVVLNPGPRDDGAPPGYRMSLVTRGHHYVRIAMGGELLFDLRLDPFERRNLLLGPDPEERVLPFRKALLDLLERDRASPQAERAYLKSLREELAAQVGPRRDDREQSDRVSEQARGGPPRSADVAAGNLGRPR